MGLLILVVEGAYAEHRTALAGYRKRYRARVNELKKEYVPELSRHPTGIEEIEKHFELKRLEPNIIYHEARVVNVHEIAPVD